MATEDWKVLDSTGSMDNLEAAVVGGKKQTEECSAVAAGDFGRYLDGRRPAIPPPAAYKCS
jgi:hypothetical protein